MTVNDDFVIFGVIWVIYVPFSVALENVLSCSLFWDIILVYLPRFLNNYDRQKYFTRQKSTNSKT